MGARESAYKLESAEPPKGYGAWWPLFIPEHVSGPSSPLPPHSLPALALGVSWTQGPPWTASEKLSEISGECAAEGPSLCPSLVLSARGCLEGRVCHRQTAALQFFWTPEHSPGSRQGSSPWPLGDRAPTRSWLLSRGSSRRELAYKPSPLGLQEAGQPPSGSKQLLLSSKSFPPSLATPFSLRWSPFPTFLLGTVLGSSSVGLS